MVDIFVRHTFRMSKNNIKTKTVLTLDSKAEKRKYVSDVLKANGYTKTFLRNCQKPVTTNSLLMKGKQRLVFLLFLTFRVLRNPSREFWTALTLKLQKNLFRLWGIFLPNLRILSGKTNEPTPFIVFLAMTVTTNTSDRPNVSLVDVWKSMKKRFSFAKKENSALSDHTCPTNHTIGWDKFKIITITRRYHQRFCLEAWDINSTYAPLNRDDGGLLPDAYLHLVREKAAN